jgi:hypothetical protein
MRTYSHSGWIVRVVLLLSSGLTSSGQTSDVTSEFWPEINIFINLNEKSRIYGLITATKQESLGAYADGQTGLYFDFWTLPALRRRLRSQVDASRSKLLLLRTGYLLSRPKNNSGAATEHMLTSEGSGRAHLPAALLLSDRNRIDLRWLNGDFNWRYRNRLKLERTFHTQRFELTPYGHAEVFYSPKGSKWTRLRYAAGMEWAVTRRIVLEGYFLRQNDWGNVPQFVNATGFVTQFYFR